jgi:hypothetical protein
LPTIPTNPPANTGPKVEGSLASQAGQYNFVKFTCELTRGPVNKKTKQRVPKYSVRDLEKNEGKIKKAGKDAKGKGLLGPVAGGTTVKHRRDLLNADMTPILTRRDLLKHLQARKTETHSEKHSASTNEGAAKEEAKGDDHEAEGAAKGHLKKPPHGYKQKQYPSEKTVFPSKAEIEELYKEE